MSNTPSISITLGPTQTWTFKQSPIQDVYQYIPDENDYLENLKELIIYLGRIKRAKTKEHKDDHIQNLKDYLVYLEALTYDLNNPAPDDPINPPTP